MSFRLLAILNCMAYATVAAQFSVSIDGQKDPWYSRCTTPEEGYLHLSPSDFIPLSGPKPNSDADLSADIWMAWDETYFYLYAEVKDDVVHVGSSVRPWNDCIELKFDPDPLQRPLTGIVNARLSALDSADAAGMPGVDNLYPERDSLLSPDASSPAHYARRRTRDGYALELRLRWEWITCHNRHVHPAVGQRFGLAVNIHDNDKTIRRRGLIERKGTIQWSAGMVDEVWLVPQYLGTVEFRPDHVLRLTRRNAIDTSDCRATTFLSAARFRSRPGFPAAIENWRYNPGDSLAWARPHFDDRLWEITYPRLNPQQAPARGWEGIGWFRAHLAVDSSLWGVPLGLTVEHAGACEIYLDGDLLYAYGSVAAAGSPEVSVLDHNPKPLVIKRDQDHLLAIRYSCANTDKILALGGDVGFFPLVSGDLGQSIQRRVEAVRKTTTSEIAFPAIAVTLGGLHILLFLFLPRTRENLYFALFMIFWGSYVWLANGLNFVTSVDGLLVGSRLTGAIVNGAIAFGLLTIYARFLSKVPTVGYAFLLACAVFAILTLFVAIPGPTQEYLVYALITLATLEIFRVFVVAARERWRERWIAAVGFATFMLSLVYQVLIQLSVVSPIAQMDNVAVGTLVLSVCFSIDLSRKFARTSKDLQEQLVQVERFSRQAIAQERLAKEEEVARRMLEADNARKTRELEDARKVQLSMLPKEVPNVPHVDIAVRMETATEIGGDYYDFYVGEDGTLTVALGDATGHGARAGTMVSVTKGLFHEFAPLSDFQTIFERFTGAFKRMNLGPLYMALLLVRLKDHSISVSSAGMPPILIYRSATGTVERIVTKGMPLGGFAGFPYQTKEAALEKGDVVLLMSDGFVEMFNPENETFDELRAVESFKEAASQSPTQIIGHLLERGTEWAGGRRQRDDVTFVVMKMV